MKHHRAKGSRGELEVAHIIMTWWAKLEPAARFIRTPLSGGWQHDSQAASHYNACGDIMTTAAFFPFCVEVKWREAWSVDRFLDGRQCPPWGWWRQTVQAAAKQTRGVPMMWMRRNRVPGRNSKFPWLVLVPGTFVREHALSEPDVVWDPAALALTGIGYEHVLPVGYVFDRFIEMSPHRMRLQRQGAA